MIVQHLGETSDVYSEDALTFDLTYEFCLNKVDTILKDLEFLKDVDVKDDRAMKRALIRAESAIDRTSDVPCGLS